MIDPTQSFPPNPGRFGGLQAADYQVTIAAFNGGLLSMPNWDGISPVYQAVLSTPTVDTRDRLVIEGQVRNLGGEIVAASGSDLWSGNLQNTIGFDEFGNPYGLALDAWTGSFGDGTHSGASCSGFTSTNSSGTTGAPNAVGTGWIDSGLLSCNQSAHIYGITPLLGIAPTVDAGGNTTAIQGEAFTRTATIDDLGDRYWTATVDYGDGGGPASWDGSPFGPVPTGEGSSAFGLDHTYDTPGTYTVTVTVNDSDPSTAAGVSTFEVEVTDGVVFPDPGLEEAIRLALAQPTGPITAGSLAGLTSLTASGKNISNLAGIEYCTGLTYLALIQNQLTDISALAPLTSLTRLHLEMNQIDDIGVLAGLTNLDYVSMWSNQIADISAVAGLTNLTHLNVNSNLVSDISAVAGLTNLEYLNVRVNSVSNIGPLAGLSLLTYAELGGNQIGDITALGGLSLLSYVDLNRTQISDISALQLLSNLWFLGLGRNEISQLDALVNNPGIDSGDTIQLEMNPLDREALGVQIPVLEARGANVRYDTLSEIHGRT